MSKRSHSACLLCVCAVSFASGCGKSKSNISAAVHSFNRQVAASGLRFECPTEVETDKAFRCDVRGTKTNRTATVRLHLVGRKKELIDFVDSAAARRAVARVAG